MAIGVEAQRNELASAYALAAPYGTLHTANPGTTGTATAEVTGGSPAYARKTITGNWATGTASSSAVTGSAVFDVGSGVTVEWAGVASTNVAGAATIRDSYDTPTQNFSSQGTYTVTYTYTQS